MTSRTRAALAFSALGLAALPAPATAVPVLAYSTLFGGSQDETGWAAAVDGNGNAYVTGVTCSADFPLVNPYQATRSGSCDLYVSKFSPEGVLLYSTYLGGPGYEEVRGIAVDAAGSAIVVGFTSSPGFPVHNAVQPALAGWEDAFIAKLSPAGDALVFSTYLGGSVSDGALAVAVDGAGNAHVAGSAGSTNFPLVNPLQPVGGNDAFVARFSPTGALLYSTYLGGHGGDGATAVAVDALGATYVTGLTSSLDFPTVNPFQPAKAGHPFEQDLFVAKLNPAGTALVFSTYLGGVGHEWAGGIGVDLTGSAIVGGRTDGTDFPTWNAVQPSHAGGFYDAFVTRFAPQGSTLVYSTYLGGTGVDDGLALAADRDGNASIVGQTYSPDFPIVDAIQPAKGVFYDAFLTRLSPAGQIVYSTFYDGSGGAGADLEAAVGVAADDAGNVYVAGVSYLVSGPDFTDGGAKAVGPSSALNGPSYAFVFRIAGGSANQPPLCAGAIASPAILWSPKHELVPIAVTGVTDPEGDAVTITVDAIAQDEPTDGVADGDTCPDAAGVGTDAPRVRAERSGAGDGRVYHLAFTARDAAGASCSGEAIVCVPHDQTAGSTCVDQGPLHDSTVCQ